MKILSKGVIFILILLAPFFSLSQNCAGFISYQTPEYPYKYNGQSKSATCESGKTYKFIVTFMQGRDYKISFYASSVFDDKIKFKIIDESSGKVVMDLPGRSDKQDLSGSVLIPPVFVDREGSYPSFDFHPISSLNLKIEIEVTAQPADEELRKGCIGILIQDKKTESEGFK